MTDYVKSTNFASKDALALGNPLKIVKGTEIDTEFNNIATAVATKADLVSPTFTGTPLAPTPALSAGGTTVATVAAIQALYPVGSIYINASVTTNPATLLGFGTWAAFGAGRVMVGLNGSDSLFDALEETGGSKDAIVVSHTHTATTAGAGAHTHTLNASSEVSNSMSDRVGDNGFYAQTAKSFGMSNPGDHTHTVTVGAAGSSGTNANLQPYITVAMWKRTA